MTVAEAECWRLLPPPDASSQPGHGPRWTERFDSLEGLVRRLRWLHARKVERLPDKEREALVREHSEPGQLDKLYQDDLRFVAEKPDNTLRIAGPGEIEPRPWCLHPTVSRRVRARLPAPTGGTSVGRASGYRVDEDSPVLVKKDEVEAIVNAMLRRPLILLAGVSGSGKTQLAKRMGKAWAAGLFHGGPKKEPPKDVKSVLDRLESENFLKELTEGKVTGWYRVGDVVPEEDATWPDRFAFTAVQSDWTEASHLWGYHVPLPAEAEGFYGTRALGVFLRAHLAFERQKSKEARDEPHFVLLDEMNLSRPEYYASDLLSAMEVQLGSKDAQADVIELHKAGAGVVLRGEGGSLAEVPPRIGWAPGVRVIGTVNVDETTFSFAPKVLDRAALLEFVDVDLGVVFANNTTYSNNGEWFKKVQEVLSPFNLHLGYRAAGEILTAFELAGDQKLALEKDRQLCHKILPRIRGPRGAVGTLLRALRKEVIGSELTDEDQNKLESGEPFNETSRDYPLSIRKIDQMLRRAYTTGFTSYFG